MNRLLAVIAFILGAAVGGLQAQPFDSRQEIDKANKQTLPVAAKAIEDNTDAKVALAVDADSFGPDVRAWGNLYIIANRIVGALSEVGRDQVGKDAIDRDVKKVVIIKTMGTAGDVVELKDHTLFVHTNASDKAMTVLQNIIVSALEKALHTGHPPTP